MQDSTTHHPASEIIDDIRQDTPFASTGNGWVLVSDRVMGGVSDGTMTQEHIEGRDAARMDNDLPAVCRLQTPSNGPTAETLSPAPRRYRRYRT